MAAPLISSMGDGSGKSALEELMAEKGSLGPNFVHSNRLLDDEIARVKSGGKDMGKAYYHLDGDKPHTEKIYVPFELHKQHNLVGRLLGPKGMTLKAIQNESQTRMSILGRGSIKDRRKEDELRNSNDPIHAHLKDELHIQVEAAPPFANMKLAAGVAEINKMLIPPIPGQPDTLLARYLDPQMVGGYASMGGPPALQSGPPHHGGRGRDGLMSRPDVREGGGRGGRGRSGRGGASYDSPRRGGRSGRGGGPRGGGPRGGGPRGGGAGGRDGVYGENSWRESRGDGRGDGSRLSSGEDFSRERPFKEERRSVGEYGRSSDPYSGDSEPYYSFADKPSRASVYGRESIPSSDYHHGSSSSEWKAPRAGRRETPRHHPYTQGSGGGSFF